MCDSNRVHIKLLKILLRFEYGATICIYICLTLKYSYRSMLIISLDLH